MAAFVALGIFAVALTAVLALIAMVFFFDPFSIFLLSPLLMVALVLGVGAYAIASAVDTDDWRSCRP